MKNDTKKLKNETKSKNKKVERFVSAWDKLFDGILKTKENDRGNKNVQ